MSALLAQARARQAAGPQPIINAEQECNDRAIHAMVIASVYPVGVRVLAWCQENPIAVGIHTHLVENLRQAIACKQLISNHLLAVWSEIPETIDAGYAGKVAV